MIAIRHIPVKPLSWCALVVLTGCQSTGETAEALMTRLEFGEGERGCVELRANVDLNPVPFLTSSASLILKKDTGPDSPAC